MNNECGAKYFDATGLLHKCELVRNHAGHHYDHRYRRTWPQTHPRHGHYANYSRVVDEEVAAVKATMKQTTVLLTLEDLKAIAFFLSDSGVDAVPDTVAKIDNALKEML